jgi:hypothetical protein
MESWKEDGRSARAKKNVDRVAVACEEKHHATALANALAATAEIHIFRFAKIRNREICKEQVTYLH